MVNEIFKIFIMGVGVGVSIENPKRQMFDIFEHTNGTSIGKATWHRPTYNVVKEILPRSICDMILDYTRDDHIMLSDGIRLDAHARIQNSYIFANKKYIKYKDQSILKCWRSGSFLYHSDYHTWYSLSTNDKSRCILM